MKLLVDGTIYDFTHAKSVVLEMSNKVQKKIAAMPERDGPRFYGRYKDATEGQFDADCGKLLKHGDVPLGHGWTEQLHGTERVAVKGDFKIKHEESCGSWSFWIYHKGELMPSDVDYYTLGTAMMAAANYAKKLEGKQ